MCARWEVEGSVSKKLGRRGGEVERGEESRKRVEKRMWRICNEGGGTSWVKGDVSKESGRRGGKMRGERREKKRGLGNRGVKRRRRSRRRVYAWRKAGENVS